jgi:DnaJ-class molecular chaperone
VDFYNILGIPRTANDAEIKRAYRTLAKRFHPGKPVRLQFTFLVW